MKKILVMLMALCLTIAEAVPPAYAQQAVAQAQVIIIIPAKKPGQLNKLAKEAAQEEELAKAEKQLAQQAEAKEGLVLAKSGE